MYCTQQDLIDRGYEQDLLQLTDPDNTGIIDAVIVAKALEKASAEIDGYLAGRYTLPLAVEVPILREKACDLAWYYLNVDRALMNVEGGIRKSYEDCIRYLELIARGNVKLPMPAAETVTQAVSNEAVMQSSGNVFSRG
jgi:phage gp36-like protein